MHRSAFSIASLGLLTISNIAVISVSKTIAQDTIPYSAEAVKIFTDTCTAQGDGKTVSTATMRAICACNIREIQKTYTFEEFTAIGTGLGEGKPAPESLKSLVQDCVAEVLGK